MARTPEAQGSVSRETPPELVRAAVRDASDDQVRQLLAFADLLRTVAIDRGFVSKGDATKVLERHVIDCARAALATEAGDRTAVDVGSGAGLPGIPLAILRPQLSVRLVEPRQGRAAFLEFAIERLGLTGASVVAAPIEAVSDAADVVVARAFAPLGETWRRVRHLVGPGGRLVYFAGRRAEPRETDLEGARLVRRLETPVLATSGPLIIIAP